MTSSVAAAACPPLLCRPLHFATVCEQWNGQHAPTARTASGPPRLCSPSVCLVRVEHRRGSSSKLLQRWMAMMGPAVAAAKALSRENTWPRCSLCIQWAMCTHGSVIVCFACIGQDRLLRETGPALKVFIVIPGPENCKNLSGFGGVGKAEFVLCHRRSKVNSNLISRWVSEYACLR